MTGRNKPFHKLPSLGRVSRIWRTEIDGPGPDSIFKEWVLRNEPEFSRVESRSVSTRSIQAWCHQSCLIFPFHSCFSFRRAKTQRRPNQENNEGCGIKGMLLFAKNSLIGIVMWHGMLWWKSHPSFHMLDLLRCIEIRSRFKSCSH